MSGPESMPPDDRLLEEFLAGQGAVRAAYRAEDERAPASLDAAVLRGAQSAAVRPHRLRPRWQVPLATAAVLTLSISVLLQWQRDPTAQSMWAPQISGQAATTAPESEAVTQSELATAGPIQPVPEPAAKRDERFARATEAAAARQKAPGRSAAVEAAALPRQQSTPAPKPGQDSLADAASRPAPPPPASASTAERQDAVSPQSLRMAPSALAAAPMAKAPATPSRGFLSAQEKSIAADIPDDGRMASQTPRVRLYDPRDAEMPSYSAEQLQSGCLHAAVPLSEQFAACRVLAGRTQSLDLAGHHLQVVFTESDLPDSGAPPLKSHGVVLFEQVGSRWRKVYEVGYSLNRVEEPADAVQTGVSPAGPLLHVPIDCNGRGFWYCGHYLLWRDGRWCLLDADHWRSAFASRLPADQEPRLGWVLDLNTLRAKASANPSGQPSCCEGIVGYTLQLGIEADRFVLQTMTAIPPQPIE